MQFIEHHSVRARRTERRNTPTLALLGPGDGSKETGKPPPDRFTKNDSRKNLALHTRHTIFPSFGLLHMDLFLLPNYSNLPPREIPLLNIRMPQFLKRFLQDPRMGLFATAPSRGGHPPSLTPSLADLYKIYWSDYAGRRFARLDRLAKGTLGSGQGVLKAR